jgi:flap endonuclease-1
MGIKNFYKFLQKYSPESFINRKICDYSGKILGIDANLLLYSFLKRNMNYVLKINNGNLDGINIEENYEMFYYYITEMVNCSYKNNIKFLMVFDGKTPDIKKSTVDGRKIEREKAKNELAGLDNSNINKKNNLLIKTIHLNSKLINSVKELLMYCGIPYIDAPFEADTQLAYLSKNNFIDGIISNDFDILTFGGKKILLDFFGYKNDSNKIIIELDLENILKNLHINYDTFIELCMFMGSDYSDKPEYSFDHIFELLSKYGNYKNISEKDKFILPENLDIYKITDYFKNPEIEEYTQIQFFNFDEGKIVEFISSHRKLIFSDRYMNTLISNMKRLIFFSNLKKR